MHHKKKSILTLLFPLILLFPVSAKNKDVIGYEELGGKIIIQAEINGIAGRFIFDTGAGPCVLSETFSKKSGIKVLTKTKVKDSNDLTSAVNSGTIESITIGHHRFTSVTAIIAHNPILECFNVDGMIGSNMLANKVIWISAISKTIKLMDELPMPGEEKAIVSPSPIKFPNTSETIPLIDLKLRLGEKEITQTAIVDLGYDGLLQISKETIPAIKKKVSPAFLEEGKGIGTLGFNGSGKEEKRYRLKVSAIQVSGLTLQNAILETTSSQTALLGSAILQFGDMIIDLKEKQFFFVPNSNNKLLNEGTWPLSPNFEDNKLVVGVVWDRALQKQIKPGDVITKINDKDCNTIGLCDLITKRIKLLQDQEVASLTIKTTSTENRVIEIKKTTFPTP